MFYECRCLTDISLLKNWNVSNGNNFQSMFSGCANLTNIKPLEKWNVSNTKKFSYMVYYFFMGYIVCITIYIIYYDNQRI